MKALLLSVLLLGCVHQAGDICQAGDAFCGDPKTDPRSALVCQKGKLVRFDCPGAEGCKVDTLRAVSCDQSSGAQAGQACFPEYEGRGQCAGPVLLQCLHGAWAQVACNPGQTCASGAGGVACK